MNMAVMALSPKPAPPALPLAPLPALQVFLLNRTDRIMPHDGDAHEQGDGRKAGGRSFARRQLRHAWPVLPRPARYLGFRSEGRQ